MQTRSHSPASSISGHFPAKASTKTSGPSTPRSRPGVMSSSLPLARSWLNRSLSSNSGTHITPLSTPKPARISEPKLDSGPRSGTLGSGATVVRTPQEALAGTSASTECQEIEAHLIRTSPDMPDIQASVTQTVPPNRHPLPPIPDFDEDDAQADSHSDTTSVRSSVPSRPTRAIPSTPVEHVSDPTPSVRSSLKSTSLPLSGYFPPVPALPANIPPSPPQIPFRPILVSPPLTGLVNPSDTIVSLETSTVTYRTTLDTLTSRPSHLSTYLQSLLPSPTPHLRSETRDSCDVSSVYSDDGVENDVSNSIFHRHLATSGLLSRGSIHVFLDRPSAPYTHILSYLRTLPSSPETPAILPRPVQLTSSSSTRLESLLELRDEARYLDLDELYKLCTEEIRLRCANVLGLHTHSRGMSNTSLTSSKSLGVLRETSELEDSRDSRRYSPQKHNGTDHRARSKDSGVGTASPSSFCKPASLESGEHGELWHSATATTVPGLQQRRASRGRGEKPIRQGAMQTTGPTGGWI